MAAAFLVAWGSGSTAGIVQALACDGSLQRWYTYLTYPLAPGTAGGGILFLVLEWLWLYWIGTSLETSEGVKRFALVFVGCVLAGSVFLALGAFLLKLQIGLSGPLVPISALTCVWCARNQQARILLMMIVPVSGRILAVVTTVLTVVMYGSGSPLLGLFAALPCALGWFYGLGALIPRRKPVVTGRGPAQSSAEFDKFVQKVRVKEKERDERERLRKLLESSSDLESDDQR